MRQLGIYTHECAHGDAAMFVETLVACTLSAALATLVPNPRYDDALNAIVFSGLSAWLIDSGVSPVLYLGVLLLYVATFAADWQLFDKVLPLSRKQHLIRVGQSALPAVAAAGIWVGKPKNFEVGLILTGAIWFKHAVLDQRYKKPLEAQPR